MSNACSGIEMLTKRGGQDRKDWYAQPYVWLVDSQAVARFDPENQSESYEAHADPLRPPCYRGWVKIGCADIPNAWFERLARAADDEYVFACEEWDGDWRYSEG